MVSAQQAIGNLFDNFLANRQRQIESGIAAQEAIAANDLHAEVFARMNEDAVKLPPGQFNAQTYIEDYNNKVESIVGNISDKRRQSHFRNVLNRSRGDVSFKAETLQLQSFQAAQKQAIDQSYNDYVQNIYANRGSQEDLVRYLNTNSLIKPSLTPEALLEMQAKEGNAIILRENLNNYEAQQQFIKGNITDLELSNVYENSLKEINSYPLEADQRIAAMNTIQREQARLLNGVEVQRVKHLKENFDGELLKLVNGVEPTKNFFNDLAKFSRTNPELETLLIELDVTQKSLPFYQARQRGDLSTMRVVLEQARQAARDPNSSGVEFKKADEKYSQLLADYSKAQKAKDENFAEFYKNNRTLQALKLQGARDGDMSQYASALQQIAVQQGDDPRFVEFLDKASKKGLADVFKNAGKDSNVVKARALELQQQWGAFYPQVINEIMAKEKSPKIAALRYADSVNFPKFWEAASLTPDEIKALEARRDIDGEDKRKNVQAKIAGVLDDYHTSIERQGDQDFVTKFANDLDLGYRLVLAGEQSTFGGIDEDQIRDAIVGENYEIKKHFDRDVVRIPIAEADPVLKFSLGKPDLAEELITNYAKSILGAGTKGDAVLDAYSLRNNDFELDPAADEALSQMRFNGLVDNVRMVTSPNEDGVMFMWRNDANGIEQPLRAKDGNIKVWSWRDIRKIDRSFDFRGGGAL